MNPIAFLGAIVAFIMGKDPMDGGSTLVMDPLVIGAGGLALLGVGTIGVLQAAKRRPSKREPVLAPNSSYFLVCGLGLVLLACWMILLR